MDAYVIDVCILPRIEPFDRNKEIGNISPAMQNIHDWRFTKPTTTQRQMLIAELFALYVRKMGRQSLNVHEIEKEFKKQAYTLFRILHTKKPTKFSIAQFISKR